MDPEPKAPGSKWVDEYKCPLIDRWPVQGVWSALRSVCLHAFLSTFTCRSRAVSCFPFSPELRLNSSMVQAGWPRFPSDRLVSLRSVYRGLPFMCAFTEGVKGCGEKTCSIRYDSFRGLGGRWAWGSSYCRSRSACWWREDERVNTSGRFEPVLELGSLRKQYGCCLYFRPTDGWMGVPVSNLYQLESLPETFSIAHAQHSVTGNQSYWEHTGCTLHQRVYF